VIRNILPRRGLSSRLRKDRPPNCFGKLTVEAAVLTISVWAILWQIGR
jgi:hypothetical protein